MMAEVGGVALPRSSSVEPPQDINKDVNRTTDGIPNTTDPEAPIEVAKLSKNQQKKLKRRQEWEEGREARKVRRKEKNKERKARRREEYGTASNGTHDSADSNDGAGPVNDTNHSRTRGNSSWKEQKKHYRALQLPLAFVFDCDFDNLMTETERISLASQLTRAYSDNRKAKYRAHMLVSSFSGKLKERFEGVLGGHHENWKSVTFTEGDFVEAAGLAQQLMRKSTLDPALINAEDERISHIKHFYQPSSSDPPRSDSPCDAAETRSSANILDVEQGEEGEVIYLTSDSPYTLTRLKPFSTYIIGGLVDKNRHKGICYKRACGRAVKTAKLPIGEYMRMSSRQVLATNHVGEIMLRWLECNGDWGSAFDCVIPKRKGGVLRAKEPEDEYASEGESDLVGEDQADSNAEDSGPDTGDGCTTAGANGAREDDITQ